MSNSLLQVDESVLEKNLTIVEKDPLDQALDSILQRKPLDSKAASTMATLMPGFCIKTHYSDTRTKVFINICKTDKLPTPRQINEQELDKILKSDAPQNYRVPITIGECRTEKDKQNVNCNVFDIGINPDFFDQCENSAIFKNFLLMLVYESLEDKFNVKLDRDSCKILRNLKCFGKLPQHRIVQRPIDYTDKNRTVIEEVSISKTTQKQGFPYRLFYANNDHSKLFAQFYLSTVFNKNDIQLDIGEDRIIVETKTCFLDIFLPVLISDCDISAIFNEHTNILTVELPTKSDC